MNTILVLPGLKRLSCDLTPGPSPSGSLVTQPSEFLARLIATGVEWDGG